MKGFSYSSPLGPYIKGLIDEKRALGYKYETEEYILRRLDDYWTCKGHSSPQIEAGDIEEWLLPSGNEGLSSVGTRVCTARQPARYMNSRGVAAYIPMNREKRAKAVIHVLSKEEIRELFKVIDSHAPSRPSKDTMRMSHEYKVLFRLYLTTGMRRSEAAGIENRNVDLGNSTITILAAKGSKDRIVYLPDDMTELLRSYMARMESTLDGPCRWLFPGLDTNNHVSPGALSILFKGFWNRTCCASAAGKPPTLHSLRHTYVVTRINTWMEEGLDLRAMLPYLSRQLGHKSPNETYYYYHQVADAFRIIQAKDTAAAAVIPEVRAR